MNNTTTKGFFKKAFLTLGSVDTISLSLLMVTFMYGWVAVTSNRPLIAGIQGVFLVAILYIMGRFDRVSNIVTTYYAKNRGTGNGEEVLLQVLLIAWFVLGLIFVAMIS